MNTLNEPAGVTPLSQGRRWRTIRSLAQRSEGAFSEAAIRAVIYRSKPHYDSRGEWVAGNGLAPHISQPGGKGGKVLIDERGWDAWLESWSGTGKQAA
jgi:hypothetical protein